MEKSGSRETLVAQEVPGFWGESPVCPNLEAQGDRLSLGTTPQALKGHLWFGLGGARDSMGYGVACACPLPPERGPVTSVLPGTLCAPRHGGSPPPTTCHFTWPPPCHCASPKEQSLAEIQTRTRRSKSVVGATTQKGAREKGRVTWSVTTRVPRDGLRKDQTKKKPPSPAPFN